MRNGLADLKRVRRVGVCTPVHTLPAAVQVVEAVVLFVDHHDVIDLPKRVRSGGRRRPARGRRPCTGGRRDHPGDERPHEAGKDKPSPGPLESPHVFSP